jgi:Protein of unknown function (DUF3667)
MSNNIICKNCGNHFKEKYCNRCGEKVYGDHDRKLGHFFKEGMHFITHFEGTFFTTVKTIFRRPGQLSTDYCNGIRKKYFKPLSLFLLLVVLYLIFPFFEGLNIKMWNHTTDFVYGDYAAQKIQRTIQQTGLGETALVEKFHVKSEKVSKFLLIAIIPFSALAFWGMGFSKRKYFYDHMVFAAEVNAFFLLWGFLLLPLIASGFLLLYHFFTGNYFSIVDWMLGLIGYTGLFLYVFIGCKRFYGLKRLQGVLFAMVFCLVHFFIVFTLYQFLLFIIVINQM